MKQIIRSLFALSILPTIVSSASAQGETWRVGQHGDYHVAMVKQADDVFVAIYVSKQASNYASPLVLETVLAPCGEKTPISLHSTEAILSLGATVDERLAEVRRSLENFFERGRDTCNLAHDLEQRFFSRFEDAYAATDAILVEAGIFPIKAPFHSSRARTDEESE